MASNPTATGSPREPPRLTPPDVDVAMPLSPASPAPNPHLIATMDSVRGVEAPLIATQDSVAPSDGPMLSSATDRKAPPHSSTLLDNGAALLADRRADCRTLLQRTSSLVPEAVSDRHWTNSQRGGSSNSPKPHARSRSVDSQRSLIPEVGGEGGGRWGVGWGKGPHQFPPPPPQAYLGQSRSPSRAVPDIPSPPAASPTRHPGY